MTLINKNPGIIKYFEGSELFYISFFNNQICFSNAWSSLSRKDLEGAVSELSKCDEDKSLELYAQNIQNGPGTIGEKAVLFSMGTRWYPDFVNIRQRAGMLPVNYKFGMTHHDPLAQGAGKYTWHIDAEKNFWSVLGYRELGKGIFQTDNNDRSYIEADSILKLNLLTVSGDKLPPGEYIIHLDISGSTQKLPIITLSSGNSQSYLVQKNKDLTRLTFTVNLKEVNHHFLFQPLEKTALYNFRIQKKQL
jgi:hypothetical protein